MPSTARYDCHYHRTFSLTDYTWAGLPMELDSLIMASHLESHIEAHSNPATNCLTISEGNPIAQTCFQYTTVPIPLGDFALTPGHAYRVEVTADAVWPYSGRGLRQFQRALHTRRDIPYVPK